jgi:hypothetical protein
MYIIDNKRQIERINDMVTLRKNMETFEVFYHDPSTGTMWKSFFPRGFQSRKGPKLLRTEPLPNDLKKQLHLCLNSEDDADAIGLGIECSVKPELWEEITELLYQNRKDYDRGNLNTFIKHLGILNPLDSLAEVELHPEDAGLNEKKLKSLRKKIKRTKLKRFFRL